MKSKILRTISFDSVDLTPYQVDFVVDEEKVEQEIMYYRKRHVSWETGKQIKSGDSVTLRLRSDMEKFNREQVRVAVGLGLFHKGLEAVLIGHEAGDCFSLMIHEKKVEITVLEVKNKVLPELTDELVRQEMLDGITTVSELKESLIQQQKEVFIEDNIYPVYQALLQAVLEESDILLTKEDWERYVVLKAQQVNGFCKFEGLELEHMTEEEFEGRIPVKSYHEFLVMLYDESWDTMRYVLLGEEIAKREQCYPNREQYNKVIQESALQWRCSPEEFEKIYDFELFTYNRLSGLFNDAVYEYARKNTLRV